MLTLVVSMNKWLNATAKRTKTVEALEAAAGYVIPYKRGVTDTEREGSPTDYSPYSKATSETDSEKEIASEQAGPSETIRSTGGQHGL